MLTTTATTPPAPTEESGSRNPSTEAAPADCEAEQAREAGEDEAAGVGQGTSPPATAPLRGDNRSPAETTTKLRAAAEKSVLTEPAPTKESWAP